MESLKIIWSKQAQQALRNIYDFYKVKSKQAAKNVINDILHEVKRLRFTKQYQVDDINPSYRRIVVRNYKILYKEKGNNIQILDIINTKESPDKLKSK